MDHTPTFCSCYVIVKPDGDLVQTQSAQIPTRPEAQNWKNRSPTVCKNSLAASVRDSSPPIAINVHNHQSRALTVVAALSLLCTHALTKCKRGSVCKRIQIVCKPNFPLFPTTVKLPGAAVKNEARSNMGTLRRNVLFPKL